MPVRKAGQNHKCLSLRHCAYVGFALEIQTSTRAKGKSLETWLQRPDSRPCMQSHWQPVKQERTAFYHPTGMNFRIDSL